MDGATVYNQSILAMRGPMSRTTTTRHDYTAKGAEKPAIIVPDGEIKISSRPLEGKTTAAMSFLEPDLSRFERQKSYAPARCYNPSRAPFDGTTVARMSYTGEQPTGPLIADRNKGQGCRESRILKTSTGSDFYLNQPTYLVL
ncbi:hypothetical protein FOCC_FOCC000568 [Frankliniella occidentalis]|nr:hypothetical protein FOCC_FOCC000568 [Frankliniella occidentalis]